MGLSVSSANFDDLCFRLNREAHLNIDDDKRQSRLITRAEFKNRSKMGKVFDALAGTLRRQL